jgi:hypothetical protein
MGGENEEVIPGLSLAELADIREKVLSRTDGNHPQLDDSEDGFLDILRNNKPSSSIAPAFVRKVVL